MLTDTLIISITQPQVWRLH